MSIPTSGHAGAQPSPISELTSGLQILHGSSVGYREFRLLDPQRQKPTLIKWFHTAEKVETIHEWLRNNSGSLDCYVGRALRASVAGADRGLGGRSGDIVSTQCVSIDIDPVGQYPLEALGGRIRDLTGGALIDSGRGIQVWCPFDREFDVRGRQEWFTACQKAWEESIVKQIGAWQTNEYKIDRQHDLARIVRVPGTINRKTGRMASVLRGAIRPLPVEQIIASVGDMDLSGRAGYGRNGGDGFRQRLSGLRGAERSVVPPRFWRILAGDLKMRESWAGRRADLTDTSGSGQDMALVQRLKARGFTAEEALAILRAKPNKTKPRDEYLAITIMKAYGHGG